jgi:hypothetical protein
MLRKVIAAEGDKRVRLLNRTAERMAASLSALLWLETSTRVTGVANAASCSVVVGETCGV